jgi:hypothetical protein
MCLLEVITIKIFILGSYATINPSFWGVIGISSLNVESNIFGTAKPTLAIHRSNNAAPEKNSAVEVRKLKFAFWGSY